MTDDPRETWIREHIEYAEQVSSTDVRYLLKLLDTARDDAMYLRYEIEDTVTEFERFSTLCLKGGRHIDVEGCCSSKGPGLYVAKGDTEAKTQEWVDWLCKEIEEVYERAISD